MSKFLQTIYARLSQITLKQWSYLVAFLIVIILFGIGGMYIFQKPPADFLPQFSCEAQPFVIRLEPNTKADFTVILNPDIKAKITEVSLGDLPAGVVGEIDKTEKNSKNRQINLKADEDAQIGSFSIAIRFSERVYKQDHLTRCQFNLIINLEKKN